MKSLHEALAFALPILQAHWDCGPEGEGWKSPELAATVDVIEAELSRRSASNTAGGQICATEGCGKVATEYFERGGVGSHHCADCMTKINALSALEPIQAGGDEPVAFGTAWQTNFSDGKWHFDVKVAFAASDVERGIVHSITPLFTRPATPVSAEVTVTDEMVELALHAYFPGEEWGLHAQMGDEIKSEVAGHMRAALTAALATLDRGQR